MAKDEPNLSSHERALNIAEELLQKGKASFMHLVISLE